jgi:sarcosine oxidase subunit gamma
MPDTPANATTPVRRSPLSHRQPIASGNGEIDLAERRFIGKLIVRGDATQIAPILQATSGIALPTVPCTSTVAGDLTALWLGPSEWLLLTPEGREIALHRSRDAARIGDDRDSSIIGSVGGHWP